MDTLTFFAILQLLQGTQPVPLNAPCSDIIKYEKSTNNELVSSDDNALIYSRNLKNNVEWLYDCSPNKKNWVVNVTQGSTDRATVEKQFDHLYKETIRIYGLPERSTKDLEADQELLVKNSGPFAVWNTTDNNVVKLGVKESHFIKSDVKKWAINVNVVTNKKADCSTLFESKKLCPDR